MSAVTESRARQLDAVLDRSAVEAGTGDELFGVVDVLGGATALRRALSDPDATAQAKTEVVDRLFGSRLSATTLSVLREAVSLRWTSMGALSAALERQAVRASLKLVEAEGGLDKAADDLFRFNRTVQSDGALRDALTDVRADLARREQLVDRLLSGKTSDVVRTLAKRALRARSYADAVEGFGTVAAQLRDRGVAKVLTAQPLSQDQEARLRAALVKQLGRSVDLQVTVDPSVLGGLRVRVGDDVIEGTVSRRLEDARRQLV